MFGLLVFIVIALIVIFTLIKIAKSSSKTKSSIMETENILRNQFAEQDKRLDPEWLSIKSELESDQHTSSDIEIFHIKWKNGDWDSFAGTAEGYDFYKSEAPEIRRKIRKVFFKVEDRRKPWEKFFFENYKSMTRDEIMIKYKEHLMLNEDEYDLFESYELGISVYEYLGHKDSN